MKQILFLTLILASPLYAGLLSESQRFHGVMPANTYSLTIDIWEINPRHTYIINTPPNPKVLRVYLQNSTQIVVERKEGAEGDIIIDGTLTINDK